MLPKLPVQQRRAQIETNIDLNSPVRPDAGTDDSVALSRHFVTSEEATSQVSSGTENSRKEVIQPQVLLQLPCYDFTPITNHTFGACLPCGLARRLLVQPAFVM